MSPTSNIAGKPAADNHTQRWQEIGLEIGEHIRQKRQQRQAREAEVNAAKKRARHAEAQRRYRERSGRTFGIFKSRYSAQLRHLEATRARARERMKNLRAHRSPQERQDIKEGRHSDDADYNELALPAHAWQSIPSRRRMKFIKKYGEDAFFKHYFPLYELYGKQHLPVRKIYICVGNEVLWVQGRSSGPGVAPARSTSQARQPSVSVARAGAARAASVKPASVQRSVKHERSISVKPEPVVKREGSARVKLEAGKAELASPTKQGKNQHCSRVAPKPAAAVSASVSSQKKLPLWADETEDEDESDDAPIANQTAPIVVLSDLEEDEGDVLMPPAPPMSPSISSASSLSDSTRSSIGGLRRIFRAPAGFEPPTGLSMPAPLHNASALSTRMLYNCNKRRLYMDADLYYSATAVRDMALKDVVEVVDADSVVEFCRARVVSVVE
ncbi:hypothetical protein C8R45DRAFT_937389 [Mycena sanguinolenta]|nr:hypothetical protein C8R45DRAFT_937389 [Mycena sanguinolenta]